MPKILPPCDECKKAGGTPAKGYDKILCKDCKFSDKYRLIYLSTAKTNYFLTEKELKLLDSFEGGIKNRRQTKLLRENDVKAFFCLKHSITGEEISNKLVELKGKRNDKKRSKIEDRKSRLESALADSGLTLRADSTLCQKYIDGTIRDWSLEGVVHRMCQMRYLFEYADMDKYLEKAHKLNAEELEAGYFPDMPPFDLAEMLALKNTGGWLWQFGVA